MVSLLTEELVRRGHDVTLFASGDSQTAGKLVAPCPRALWRDPTLRDPHACIMRMMSQLGAQASDFDIIHNHAGFYFTPFAKCLETPSVMTVHRPIHPETKLLYQQEASYIRFVAISHDQASSLAPVPAAQVIYNGIPLERYPFSQNPNGYVLFLSKIDPEKGIIEAIEAARLAQRKLIICGNIVGEAGHEFFVRRVKPRLNDQIVYVGQADFAKKIELFSRASALLFPVRRREPFGMVIAESLACGTPVIAFRAGSTPELIEDGKTGFLVNSIPAMARAVQRIPELQRSVCREAAEKRFSHLRMVDEYETLYHELLEVKT